MPRPAITAALEDRLAWIAYPNAGKSGTDLNRDILARLAEERGNQPVCPIGGRRDLLGPPLPSGCLSNQTTAVPGHTNASPATYRWRGRGVRFSRRVTPV